MAIDFGSRSVEESLDDLREMQEDRKSEIFDLRRKIEAIEEEIRELEFQVSDGEMFIESIEEANRDFDDSEDSGFW